MIRRMTSVLPLKPHLKFPDQTLADLKTRKLLLQYYEHLFPILLYNEPGFGMVDGNRGRALQVAATISQPLPILRKSRHDAAHLSPKFRRMVTDFQMGELVNNNVIDDLRGELHDAPMKIQLAIRAA